MRYTPAPRQAHLRLGGPHGEIPRPEARQRLPLRPHQRHGTSCPSLHRQEPTKSPAPEFPSQRQHGDDYHKPGGFYQVLGGDGE